MDNFIVQLNYAKVFLLLASSSLVLELILP